MRFHAGRITAVMLAIAAAVFIVASSASAWVRFTSPVGINVKLGGGGLSLALTKSGSLADDEAQAVRMVAAVVGVAAIASLLPFARLIGGLVVAASGVGAALLGFATLEEIRSPEDQSILAELGRTIVRTTPATGVYLIIVGGGLALISGLLILLTPRRAGVEVAHRRGAP